MIEIKDIEFGYRSKNILHNISFDMNEGPCIAILGVNGAGKSTLIKCLNRINPVHKGAVMIENSNILQIHLNEVAKKIAYVAQKNEVSKLTVYDAILLGRKPYIKWDVTKQDKEIVDQVIEQLELQDYKMRFLDELSGGELQKVIVARALAQQPKLLLLDEPTSALDPKNQYEMWSLVQKIAQQHQIAVAIVIHDINLALRYCDRFLFIKDTEIYSYGGIETMTADLIEEVYHMPVAIEEYHGIKIMIPHPNQFLSPTVMKS